MVMSDPRAQAPEDAKFVHPSEGHEHGYYGVSPGIDEDATVAGVTGDSDKAPEKPAPANRSAAKKEADK